MLGISRVAEQVLASEAGLNSKEWVSEGVCGRGKDERGEWVIYNLIFHLVSAFEIFQPNFIRISGFPFMVTSLTNLTLYTISP
jgi:hypothetical protein